MTRPQVYLKGIYRHYKGPFYQVYRVSQHTERDERLVVYRSLAKNEYWARPIDMFCDTVKINGIDIQRFELIRVPI